MSQTYTHAGISRQNGEYKVRFCNDALRTKVLQKNGHKDIDIVPLKHPMTKPEAVEALRTIMRDSKPAVVAAIEQAAEKYGVAVAAKKEQRPTKEAKKPKKPSPSKAAKTATPQVPALEGMTPLGLAPTDTVKLEDAPF